MYVQRFETQIGLFCYIRQGIPMTGFRRDIPRKGTETKNLYFLSYHSIIICRYAIIRGDFRSW